MNIWLKHLQEFVPTKLFLQIQIDFKILFPKIEDQSLLSAWPNIENLPSSVFKIQLKRNEPYFINKDIHRLISFLKLLPTHRHKFETSVNAFISFSSVSA